MRWPWQKRSWVPGRVIDGTHPPVWGDHIEWFDWEKRTVYGHMPRIPEVDDEIRFRMDSGRIGRFRVVAVRRELDPPDMFFATVADIGYLEEFAHDDPGHNEGHRDGGGADDGRARARLPDRLRG